MNQISRASVFPARAALVALIITLIIACEANAKFVTVDANGREVEIVFKETKYQRFMNELTFDTFVALDDTDRQYALPTTLIDLVDAKRDLTSNQRIGLRHVVAQYFDTMSEEARATIARKAIWISMLGERTDLTAKLISQYTPRSSDSRSQVLCNLASDVTQMLTYNDDKVNARRFQELPKEIRDAFSKLVAAEKSLSEEPCPLSDQDDEPMTLKGLARGDSKRPATPETASASAQSTASIRTGCSLPAIRSTFNDAVETIKRAGPRHRVYLGMGATMCPIYGLLIRDLKDMYRFYQNTFRSDGMPTVTFKSVDELMSQVQVPELIPAQKAGAGAVRDAQKTSP